MSSPMVGEVSPGKVVAPRSPISGSATRDLLNHLCGNADHHRVVYGPRSPVGLSGLRCSLLWVAFDKVLRQGPPKGLLLFSYNASSSTLVPGSSRLSCGRLQEGFSWVKLDAPAA